MVKYLKREKNSSQQRRKIMQKECFFVLIDKCDNGIPKSTTKANNFPKLTKKIQV